MSANTGTPNVTVYWRPGCWFCSSLLHRLNQTDIAYDRVNIWEQPDAAAFVRSVARGHETVPTVTVGDRAMVNPSVAQVQAAVNGEPPPKRRRLGAR